MSILYCLYKLDKVISLEKTILLINYNIFLYIIVNRVNNNKKRKEKKKKPPHHHWYTSLPPTYIDFLFKTCSMEKKKLIYKKKRRHLKR